MTDEIIDEVRRRLKKTDADLRVSKELLDLNEEPWIITFHAQQAIEKYLKAYLVYKQVKFKKTHDILDLLDLCINEDKEFEKLKELDLEGFSEYATEFRHPSYLEPTLEEAEEAIRIAEKVRELVVKKLNISV